MTRTTKIEWTEATWNPIAGCSIASPGCRNCYAMRMAARLQGFGQATYQGLTEPSKRGPVWTGQLARASDTQMRKPLGLRKPTVIFVNSMSDLFHPDAHDAWRDEAYSVMSVVDRHTYQILTKRPEVAARYYDERPHLHGLPQIWLGVSVENADYRWRIDDLRHVPAATRFLSIEPLIGPVGTLNLDGIHWVITGGESGPRARPCNPDWIRDIRDQSEDAGVALFHKQWGAWNNNPLCLEHGLSADEAKAIDLDPKAKGGAQLDAQLYRAMPHRAAAVT